ncbi:terminase small subunit [Aeromonas phage vB_AveS_KLEA5]|nr:terminase small subunit [Aeromonas phage vB_AveS_KLEA5]
MLFTKFIGKREIKMLEKSVRKNHPSMVSLVEQIEQYRTLYDDITANGTVIQYADRHALGLLACMLCQYDKLLQELMDNGAATEVQGDRAMITKKNPAGDLLLRLGPQIKAMFAEFKMTPASRGKTFGGTGETPKTVDDGFGDI